MHSWSCMPIYTTTPHTCAQMAQAYHHMNSSNINHEIKIEIGNQIINNTTYHPILIYNQFNDLTNNQTNKATILILPINNSCIHVRMHIYLPIYIYIHTYTYTLKSIYLKIHDSFYYAIPEFIGY